MLRACVTICWILGASLVAACFEVLPFVPPNEPSRDLAPRSADDVVVLDAAPPDQPYVERGLITRRCRDMHSYPQPDSAAILTCYREEAARHGCDAIVMDERPTDQPMCIAYAPYSL
jgi:hypothetical protein